MGFPSGSAVKNMPAKQQTWVQSLSKEDPLEKDMPTHSSSLPWEIPWAEESGGLQSIGSDTTEHASMIKIAHGLQSPFQWL